MATTAKKKGQRPKKLVIVESPTKARTVGKFLGSSYVVRPSVGHIRDLPANRLGVEIELDFKPRYVIPEKKKEGGDPHADHHGGGMGGMGGMGMM